MRRNNFAAIAAMLGAVGSFAVMDATMKHLAGYYSPMQIACMRGLASLPFLLAATLWNRGWQDLRMQRPWLHLMRGLLGVVMLVSFVYAVARMSLANTYALYLCSPLLVTALSVPMLGAQVSIGRWVAIAVGLGGALIVLRPNASGFSPLATLAAAISAIAYAISAVTINVLGRTDSKRVMVLSFVVAMSFGAGLLAAPHWKPLAVEHFKVVAGLGLAGAMGQYLITEAFSRAPPFVVAPFEYTAIVWALAFDWAFWQVMPNVAVLLGGAIVIACGLFIIWDERRSYLVTPAVVRP